MLVEASKTVREYLFDDPNNLLRVSQHFESVFGRDKLIQLLRAQIDTGKEPSAGITGLTETHAALYLFAYHCLSLL